MHAASKLTFGAWVKQRKVKLGKRQNLVRRDSHADNLTVSERSIVGHALEIMTINGGCKM